MQTINLAEDCICCNSRNLSSSSAVLMPFISKRVYDYDPVEITVDWGMRDLKLGVSYFPCKSLWCHDCGLLFLDHRFTDEQMALLYVGYRGATYTKQRNFFEPGYADGAAQDFSHRHKYVSEVETWLKSFLPNCPTILDWGGGDGANTPFIESGNVHVYDISGVEVVKGAKKVSHNDMSGRNYDLVTCMQVLEHVPSPSSLLNEIIPQLSKSSFVYLEVPYEGLVGANDIGTDLAPLKKHWHEHINFFSELSLRSLCQSVGLEVIQTHKISFDNGTRKGEMLGLLAKLRDSSPVITE